MSLWSCIANVVGGDRLSHEIDGELRPHIQEAVEEGRDAAEARRALVRLGREKVHKTVKFQAAISCA
jgi:hypothetical protein